MPKEVRLVKAMVFFPVVMYGCERCTIKKAEHWRFDVSELWCWRRLLRVLWTARRSSQSILKEIRQAEAPIIWPSDVKNWLIWKDHDARKDWRQEEKGSTEDEMVGWYYWLNEHEFEQASVLVMDREAWHAAVHGVAKFGHDWATELNWTSFPEWLYSFTFSPPV